jgi:hypothetical protein
MSSHSEVGDIVSIGLDMLRVRGRLCQSENGLTDSRRLKGCDISVSVSVGRDLIAIAAGVSQDIVRIRIEASKDSGLGII